MKKKSFQKLYIIIIVYPMTDKIQQHMHPIKLKEDKSHQF